MRGIYERKKMKPFFVEIKKTVNGRNIELTNRNSKEEKKEN